MGNGSVVQSQSRVPPTPFSVYLTSLYPLMGKGSGLDLIEKFCLGHPTEENLSSLVAKKLNACSPEQELEKINQKKVPA